MRTATDMIARGPLTTDAENRPCPINLATVLLDGLVRDRCPYVGDQAVSGMTLLVSTPAAATVLHDMILWYASAQYPDGSIRSSPYDGIVPPNPVYNGQFVLFDYNAFWVDDLYDYVLYTGDTGLAAQVWPNLVQLMNVWYPAQAGSDGLVVNNLGPMDYAYVRRQGTVIAYYNAGYALALERATAIATWMGNAAEAQSWRARESTLAAPFNSTFWDASAGAYLDSPTGTPVHPEDGNVFAILAGLATSAQAHQALAHLASADGRSYGNTMADNDTWDNFDWGTSAKDRAYPFIGYFEVLARFQTGSDASALDLIRREWGYMLANGPKLTMWEDIGPFGRGPTDSTPSYDHGWSSGAAPALTNYVLGVSPASPGFQSFNARPHLSGLAWARGAVPTPHGTIDFSWTRRGKTYTATAVSPVPGTITLPVVGASSLDGKKLLAQHGETTVKVGSGSHTLVVTKR